MVLKGLFLIYENRIRRKIRSSTKNIIKLKSCTSRLGQIQKIIFLLTISNNRYFR